MFAIVGGGISGLALALGLVRRGKDAVVLEASAHVGGALRSWTKDGFLLEASANSFIHREPATHALLDALGLTPRVRAAQPTAKRRWLVSQGALTALPASPAALLRTPLLSARGKLRLLGELWSARGRRDDESLAAFAERHVGGEAAAVLVDAMQTGIYAGDMARLSAEATFPRWVDLERTHRSLALGMVRTARTAPRGEVCTLEGGMGALPAALHHSLGGRVRTQTRVTALVRAGTQWVVRFDENGVPGSLNADQVVLATPAPAAAELLSPLDAVLAESLGGIAYAPIAVVHLGFDRAAFERAPEGFGFLAPAREKRNVLGCIFVSSTFPWRAPADAVLLSCLLGGAHRPELLDLSEDALSELALSEVRALLGVRGAPKLAELVRWPRGIPQYETGHLDRLASINTRLAPLKGLSLLGNAYRGVGVNDCIREAAQLSERLAGRAE